MVIDTLHMVAVVIEAVDEAEDEVATHEVVGASWLAPKVVAHKRKRRRRI